MNKNSKPQLHSFWISNISKMNVCLRDLNLTVKAQSHANLLDNKHYSYTLEQLQKSAESGSLFRKRDKIKVRTVPPEFVQDRVKMVRESLYKTENPLFSQVVIKEVHIEELIESEDEQANDIANLITGMEDDEESDQDDE